MKYLKASLLAVGLIGTTALAEPVLDKAGRQSGQIGLNNEHHDNERVDRRKGIAGTDSKLEKDCLCCDAMTLPEPCGGPADDDTSSNSE